MVQNMMNYIKTLLATSKTKKKPISLPSHTPPSFDLTEGVWEEYLLPSDRQKDIKFTGKLLQTHLNTKLYITKSGKYITYIGGESGGSYCILNCVTDIYQNEENHPCLLAPLLEKMGMIEFMGEYTDPSPRIEYALPPLLFSGQKVCYKFMVYKVKASDSKIFILWESKEYFRTGGYFLYAKPELFDLKNTEDLKRWLGIHPPQTSKALRKLLDLDIKEIE